MLAASGGLIPNDEDDSGVEYDEEEGDGNEQYDEEEDEGNDHNF